jgi:hypothetical protein
MNGIAISLYDKFEEISILVDIIRENWDEKYYISVSSNHPSAQQRAEELDIDVDEFSQGAQIRYDDSLPGPRGGNNLHYRIYNNFRTASRPVIKNENVEYMMHLHADAWPLSESGLYDVIDEMERKDVAVAFPSMTKHFTGRYPPGTFEDQFIVFDTKSARDVNLFEHSTVEFPPTSIHYLLPMICIVKFGWGDIYQYTNGSEREHWDGTPSTKIKNDARPMFFNPKFDQLHIAAEDFDGSLGKELQAHYLSKFNLNRGKSISEFIDKHHRSKDQLFADLESYLENINKQLPPGVSVDTFGRDIRVVRQYISEESNLEKIKILAQQNSDTILYPVMKGFYRSIRRLFNASDGPNHAYNQYPSKLINDVFRDELSKQDLPEEMHAEFESSFGKSQKKLDSSSEPQKENDTR